MMRGRPPSARNRETFSDTVLRHSAKTMSSETSASAAPSRRSVKLRAANQSCRRRCGRLMTPARSPNMKSGWAPETQRRQRLALEAALLGRRCDDLEAAIGDGEMVAWAKAAVAPGPLQELEVEAAIAGVPVGQHQRVGKLAGGQAEDCLGVALDVVAPGHQRHDARRRDDDQEKDDDKRRDRAAQDRLGRQQAAISGLGQQAGVTDQAGLAAAASSRHGGLPRARPTRPLSAMTGSPACSPWWLGSGNAAHPNRPVRNQR